MHGLNVSLKLSCLSVTSHVNNQVQHYECLPAETLSMMAGFSPCFRVWPLGTAKHNFAFWDGDTSYKLVLYKDNTGLGN